MDHRRTPSLRTRQRGAALLLAMVILVLVSTLASGMVYQQWRAIQVETAERARTQAGWILTGALDWARLILRVDARGAPVDFIGEPWSFPLEEARISTFLAADRNGNASDDPSLPEAFLSGAISDAQARFNLTGLMLAGKIDPLAYAGLERLCQEVGVSAEVATRIATGMKDAAAGTGASLEAKTFDQLTYYGIDPTTLERLRPYLVILPVATAVNLNTAPKEVLVAAVAGLDAGTAQRLVSGRTGKHYDNVAQAQALLTAGITLDPKYVGVTSNYFEVIGQLRLGDRAVRERSLLERNGVNPVVVRERVRINLAGPNL